MLNLSTARRFACGALTLLLSSAGAYATTAVESSLYTLSGSPSPLIQASDGNFYGTSPNGGTSSKGFVFQLTPGGAEAVIYNFTGVTDGGTPEASLIEGNDGTLYGTDTTGGAGNGVLFQLTMGGSITVLHTFATADGTNAGALIEDNAGDIYGAATNGGSGSGTVFEYSHAAVFSVLHTFAGGSLDGAYPNTQLVMASDGLIYGATVRGGSSTNSGSLYRFDPTDLTTFATYASFPPTLESDPDYNPTFGLTEGVDGALYGATAEGGTGYGTIYKVVPGSTPTVTLNLFQFQSFNDGGLLATGLTLGGDGNFYGTTSSYGPGGPPNGTVFQYLPAGSGAVNVLYSFNSPAGNASGAPLQASDGNFYGPASSQIYKLVLTPSVPAPVTLTALPASITVGASITLDWQVVNAYSQTFENCYAHGDWSGSQALSGSTMLTPASPGTYNYALTCGGVESALATVVVNPAAVSQTATPVITPGGGSFTGPVAYNITDATPGAVIHYTQNGSTPTVTSPIWGGIPVVLIGTTTVRAIAVASPLAASNVATAVFTIHPNDLQTCIVNYIDGFATPTGLKLNHGASVTGSALELTHGGLYETASAFTLKRIPVKTFATAFRFVFKGANPTSADGMTFTIQGDSPAAYGVTGGGLGYQGISHSVAVKFDLHNNVGEGQNSVGVFFEGAFPGLPAVDLTPSGVNLHSGHDMLAYITYDGLYLTLDLVDTVTAAHFTHNFKLPAVNPIGASTAYAGFTAATGSHSSTAQVLNWALESAGPCERTVEVRR